MHLVRDPIPAMIERAEIAHTAVSEMHQSDPARQALEVMIQKLDFDIITTPAPTLDGTFAHFSALIEAVRKERLGPWVKGLAEICATDLKVMMRQQLE